jgi:porphyrinogen peroxidase
LATIYAGGEDAVRALLADLSGVVRTVGTRVPTANLSLIAGIGSEAWDRVFAGPRPSELHRFAELHGPRHHAPSTPGDLLFHLRAAQADLCFELASQIMDHLRGAVTVVDEVHGFKYFDDRDLLGFVDGTENPSGAAAAAAVVIGDQDPDFAGGSYVIVQKYLHDLTRWNAMTTEDQELAIGRRKLSNAELSDADKPGNSHVALNTIEDPDGTPRQILRDNMAFGRVGTQEFGTYFIGYACTPTVTERMLHNMFIGNPPGNTDRILDFSTAVTGTLFFVPTADFLDDLPPAPGSPAPGAPADADADGDADADADGAAAAGPLPPPSAPAADGSLGIGGLRSPSGGR